MATRNEAYRMMKEQEENGGITLSSEVQHGNTDKVFPFQIKLEADQKCVKPTISVYGGDIDKCITQAWEAYDKVIEQGKDRGIPVAPLTVVEK